MLYITGITGHSGRWLYRRLVQENHPGKIRVVMRQSREAAPEKYELFRDCPLDLEFAIGDLEDLDFLKQSMAGADTVIHTSTIHLSEKVMEAAISNGVNWAILVHTTGRFSKYKSASEEYIRIEEGILKKRDQIHVTILRPTMIYGSSMDKNMYRLISFLHKHSIFPLFGDGTNLMQPVYARDLGNAYFDVLTHGEVTLDQEYDLSGKEPIPYIEVIRCISRLLNKKTTILSIPFGLSVLAAKAYNLVFRKRAIISVEQVLRLQEDKVFSHEAATRDFGYSPLAFEEGIQEEVAEFLAKAES